MGKKTGKVGGYALFLARVHFLLVLFEPTPYHYRFSEMFLLDTSNCHKVGHWTVIDNIAGSRLQCGRGHCVRPVVHRAQGTGRR
jgi:hypothetical protein